MGTKVIYLDPSDDSVSETEYSDSDTEYSGFGVLATFVSDTNIFEFDQDLGAVEGDEWTIIYNARATGLTGGYVGVISFNFYKRDSEDNDTLIFTAEKSSLSGFYSVVGYTLTFDPYDFKEYFDTTVTTEDRLVVEVTGGQRQPS